MSATKAQSRKQTHASGEKESKGGTALEAQLAFEQELLVGLTVDVLNAIMAESGVTQRELAARLGVTEGRVSQILSGSQNVSLRKLAALGWALGVRFQLIPTASLSRDLTPAKGDPGLSSSIESLPEALRASLDEL